MQLEEDAEDIVQIESSEVWLLSYADVVTVLLCFFIIFYSIERKIKVVEKRQINLSSDVLKTRPPKEIVSGQSGELKNDILESVKGVLQGLVGTQLKVEDGQIVLEESQDRVDLVFKGQSFFKSGETSVHPEGKKLIKKVTDSLSPISEEITVEIQGYTDAMPVAEKPGRWWKSNMELSVLRALNVYDQMLRGGFKKESLSVSGFGAHRTISSEGVVLPADRRITFRIELKKNDK